MALTWNGQFCHEASYDLLNKAKKFTLEERAVIAILIVLMIPLFYLNMNIHPGWGGDYALYIKQSKHIAMGLPQSQLGYIYNQYHPSPP